LADGGLIGCALARATAQGSNAHAYACRLVPDDGRSDEYEFWADADREDEDRNDVLGAGLWGVVPALAVVVAQAVRDFFKEHWND
jgi:hypothetical protein